MAELRKLRWLIVAGLFGLALLLAASPDLWAQAAPLQAPAGGVPRPVIEAARGGECVKDPAFMRRNHMELLRHQRDETLRGGVRAEGTSLKACIACHASADTGSVAASSTNFCQSCHVYAAVKIDCFECHASKPPKTSFAPLVGHGESANSLNLQLRERVVQQGGKP